MKILLLADYFYPFNPGGSEWSVFELAKSLKKLQHDAKVVTMNYGTRKTDTYFGVPIIRLPFFKRTKQKRSVVSSIYLNNPFFFVYSAFHFYKICKKEKPNIIHIHGKFLIPAGIVVGAILGIQVVVTLRDKQLLCNIGKCFFDPNRKKACNLREFITEDFPWFYNNYINNKSVFKYVRVLISTLWERLSFNFIKFVLSKADKLVAISNSQTKYFEANGFKKISTIYNTADFQPQKIRVAKNKSILYAGKLSNGKGTNLLIATAELLNKTKKTLFIFAGQQDSSFKVTKRNFLKYVGNVSQQELSLLYKNASVTVMPSTYPEAFGRVAMESLAYGTPTVVTNIGALPEIIEDKVTGRVTRADAKSLAIAIEDVLLNEEKYKNNIKNNYNKLKNKFMDEPIKQHLKLYKSLLK